MNVSATLTTLLWGMAGGLFGLLVASSFIVYELRKIIEKD